MSSNPAFYPIGYAPAVAVNRSLARAPVLLLLPLALCAAPLAAQDDAPVTQEAQAADPQSAAQARDAAKAKAESDTQDEPLRVNLAVTVPRGEVNEAAAQECVDRADAATISGDIIVCRRRATDTSNSLSGSRAEAQKRYAQETAFKDAPRAPNVSGLGDNGRGIGIGGVPPPALIIDVGALPDAPPGSDADRIARGLPPLGQDEDLTEEEIRKRREKLGLPPPAFEKKRGN